MLFIIFGGIILLLILAVLYGCMVLSSRDSRQREYDREIREKNKKMDNTMDEGV